MPTQKNTKKSQQGRDILNRYEHLISSSTDLMSFVDRNYVYQAVNDTYLSTFGKTRNQIVGHKMSALLGKKLFEKNLKPRLDQCLRGKRIHFQHWLTPPGGKSRFWDVRYEPCTEPKGDVSGIIIVVRDITDQKRAEEALQNAQFALEHAPEAVFFMTRDAGFSYVNEQACRSLGYTKDELEKLKLWEIDPIFPKESWDALWGQPQEEEVATTIIETIHRRKDGSEFPVEVSAKHLRHGDHEFHVAFVRDISDRKQAEEKRLMLERQVQYAQKLESLGVLAGGIAHDFNNLLTSILGYSDLVLLELPANSPVRGYIEEVVKGTRQAAALTQQMLAYSGKGQFVVQPLDLSEVVKDMDRLLGISISKKCVLKYEFQPKLPAIEADTAQIRQVIMNLVINASEAIGEGSGVIAVSTGAMSCDRAYLSETFLDADITEGLYVYLEVSDNGRGMSKETREKIFDPFFTTKFTGRGLGLAAILGIVRGHHGTIKVYSEPGKGSTFKALFPASSKEALAQEDLPEQDTLKWQGRGTVLIIDDEESVRALAGEMMEKMGFTVLSATNGREGLELFRREADRIDLVLLDMTMPHLDGEEVFREMRRIRRDVRTILSSGYNEQSATNRFTGKGLAGFIQKPYRYDELMSVVRDVMGA